jgi:TPR repeat protein
MVRMNSRRAVEIPDRLLWCFALAFLSTPASFAQIASGSAIQIPDGVHYKAASDAVNSSAKEALTLALHSAHGLPADLFDSAVTCGPSLWKALQPSADGALLNSKVVVGVVNSVQVEARGLTTDEQQKSFWRLLLTKYPALATASVRRANEQEIRYYWATIPFDIEEPLFAVDDHAETFIVNFRLADGKARLFWIDLVSDLGKLTAGPPKVIDLTVSTTMAEGGDVASMLQLGKSYLTGSGVPVDTEKSRYWLDRACAKGSLEAQMFLGASYMSGVKLPKDPALAFKYILLAAQQANPDPSLRSSQALAQYWAAMFYEHGSGVEKSHDKAIQFLKSAATNGSPLAEFDLGSLFNNGAGGMPIDKVQACHLFGEAADQGNVRAMHNVAYCYQVGVGMNKDSSQAIHYYTRAAEAGDTGSQHNLAMVYGELGEADKAYFWLRVAQSSGYTESQDLIETAKKQLSVTEVNQQEKEVLDWLNAHKLKQAGPSVQ